jgi:hypothetical protein
MKEEQLWEQADGYNSYLEVLCKAILLDKVKIVNGRIKVEPLE